MEENRMNEFSDMELDVLKEISNIGTGNAATSISQMLDSRVDIEVPVIKIMGFDEMSEVVGGAEKEVIGILVTLDGDIDGMMMFMTDKYSAAIVVNRIMGREFSELTGELSEMEVSVLTEFGNIIAGSYLSAISKLMGLVIVPSVPALSDDMAGAILSVPAIEFGKVSDRVLLIQSVFDTDNKRAEGFFILIPTRKAYDTILKKLGLVR